MFDVRYFAKENTRNRLLKRAAELWGYDDRTFDNFDPLVRLLLEACSVEFEKLGRDIQKTELRLIERLAQALCPEVASQPRPAHALVHARATEPETTVTPETAFTVRRQGVEKRSEPNEVFFSPVADFKVFNASIAGVITPSVVYQTGPNNQRSILTEATAPMRAGERWVWLGLDVDSALLSPGGFRFYFDWPDHPYRETFRDFLPQTRWQSGKKELPTTSGWEPSTAGPVPETAWMRSLERHVLRVWEKHIQVVGQAPEFGATGSALEPYPSSLETRFGKAALQPLKQQLRWIRVEFPQAFPVDGLNTMVVSLNAFPVLNRRLNKISYRLQTGLNAVPLPSEEAFVGVRSVQNQQQRVYAAEEDAQRFTPGTYVVRQQGVGRFDERDGRAMLYQLADLLRDERVAFSAVGEEFLASLTNELSQNLAKLEQKLGTQQTVQTTPQPFMMVRTDERGETVYASYWTTLAEQAQAVAPGSVLQQYAGSALKGNELYLITRPAGGRPRLNGTDYVAELRKNLLTRNRLVTIEDIRTFCQAELGGRLRSVEVRRSFMVGRTANQGFMRCLQVLLLPADLDVDAAEWTQLCESLRVKIEDQSMAHLPIQVERVAP